MTDRLTPALQELPAHPIFAQQGLVLLLVCAVVAMLARRLRLPYTVALLLAGLGLDWVPGLPPLQLTRSLVFSVLLPPLIFEGALELPWAALRPLLRPVVAMASLGLVVAAAVTAAGMTLLAGWPLPSAALFGVLIGATDPVAVIATFRENRVSQRLRVLVEAESLLNDGTAAVLFSLLLGLAAGTAPTLAGVLQQATLVIGGGVLCGAAVAGLLVFLAGRTTDHLVEITFTVVAAYGAFLLAEHWACSGVLATLTAGLIFGAHQRRSAVGPTGRAATRAFWEFAAFVANSLVFLLIGAQLARQALLPLMPVIALAIGVVLAGRCCAVYPLIWPFRRGTAQVGRGEQHVLVWGGLRGALGLALALGLPDTLPGRTEVIGVTFAVVAFSVLVQGLTMPLLLRRLGLLPAHPAPDSGGTHRPG